ncbi:2-hydroxyacid dehydrogenase [Christensenella sp. NSJ-35]|uniref:2-hydroxyacid dehydrogenase n=2 Tax=Christensenella tenuis TaxID=2763033 RepID=A0ABR7EFY5_9FIRM|nr:2-hydroxyacid dehydrogenase [Christensenella tenuis]
MNCLAIGDLKVTSEIFDKILEGCSLFDRYESIEWHAEKDGVDWRNVVRRVETMGYRSYDPPDGLAERMKNVEILFVHLCPVSEKVMDAAPKLKYIMTVRGGVENIDVQAARKRGISIINCPAHNAVAVAEYTIGLIISEMRNITRADRALRDGMWREQYPNSQKIRELSDACVGLAGLGTIGLLVAKYLKAFGTKVLAYDPCLDAGTARENGIIPVTMQELLERADIVSLHARIPAGSPPIIGEEELRKMKPTAYLINTARAALVDMEALENALKTGEIMGAAIDVFPQEPVDKEEPLLKIDSVTVTNHRGGDTYNSYAMAPALLVKQLREYLETGKGKCIIH